MYVWYMNDLWWEIPSHLGNYLHSFSIAIILVVTDNYIYCDEY